MRNQRKAVGTVSWNVTGKSLALLLLIGGVAWGFLRGSSLASEAPSAKKQEAPAVSPASPQVIVREIVREVGDNSPSQDTISEEIEDVEEQADAVEAALENGFQEAPRRDDEAVQAEGYLQKAFALQGAKNHDVECRKSYCRIEASFASERDSNLALSNIFLAEGSQRDLPHLASTVSSRIMEDDGTTHVRIYLHPD